MSTPTDATDHPVERTSWSAVLAVALGVVLVGLDMTVVAVTLPLLGEHFHVSANTTQWVMLAYMLPLVALSVPAGRWLDRASLRAAFLLAVGGFGVTSLLIALAPSMPALLAGRFLQGVFGSLVGVVGMPIVARSVRPEHRARAMSIVLTLIPLSGVAGPAIGGILADTYGWRAVFLINLPIVVAAALLARRTITARAPGHRPLPLPSTRQLAETGVLAVGMGALLLSVDSLGSSGYLLAGVLLASTVLAVIAWLRMAESQPVRGLLHRRALALPLLALPMMTAGVGTVNFLVPYFLAGMGASPTTIGAILLAVSAGMAVTSPIAGVLADRIGTQPVSAAGAVTATGGMLALLAAGEASAPVDLIWRLALVGIGNGLFAGPNTTAILQHTPAELTGTSSGVTALLRTLGFALGPALGALAWTASGGGADGWQSGIAIVTAGSVIALLAALANTARKPRQAHTGSRGAH